MVFCETDKRFYIKDSEIPGAGKGLFAKVPLSKGDCLEVIGVLISGKSVSDICTHYADLYKFRVGANLLIPIGYGVMANHSSTPNMEKVLKENRVYLRALRPIQRDEELVFRYSDYAQEKFLPPEEITA